ncbi:unnamed protein product [Protopolystoma xenopodis]|uniref:Uncharacterized protein n=1 Tax=Protopolystoma xenopodis TaxID=117903 RepID=A0A3S5AZC4_9PLAT|nr:unnamed protein product [Protopolystoma xenopodis]
MAGGALPTLVPNMQKVGLRYDGTAQPITTPPPYSAYPNQTIPVPSTAYSSLATQNTLMATGKIKKFNIDIANVQEANQIDPSISVLKAYITGTHGEEEENKNERDHNDKSLQSNHLREKRQINRKGEEDSLMKTLETGHEARGSEQSTQRSSQQRENRNASWKPCLADAYSQNSFV